MPLNKQYLGLLTTKSSGIIKIYGNGCSLQDVYVCLCVYMGFFPRASKFFFACAEITGVWEISAVAQDFEAIY